MKPGFTQIFLLVWIVAFWVYYFSTYGKIEEKHERSFREKTGGRARWGLFFGAAFSGWTAIILVYFFHYDSRAWLWRFSFLDCTPLKIAAIAILGCAFLLNILFTVLVGKSIQAACGSDRNPELITRGIYGRIRHPAYLAFLAFSIGTFLLIPNLITLLWLTCTVIVVNGHAREEEKRLLKIYGEAYERYQSQTGRFLPKLNKKPLSRNQM